MTRSGRGRRWQVIIAVGAILAAIGVLTAVSLRPGATTYYYTVDEFAGLRGSAAHRYVQVNGMLQPGFQWSPQQLRLTFTIAGKDGHKLPVVYNGPEPNPFLPGVTSVVVAGRLGRDGVFHARQLLVKCPSRYKAAGTG